jgi:glycosyltransferase involved in cell wall biosynthesis
VSTKISIIVPVYNTEKYLRSCLDSILAQTFTDWEAVLVDDGSKDQSGAICDEYAEHDLRFVVVHKQNEGVAKARITAFEHSKGELITFIDSDDYVSPEYLEKLAKPIIEDGADMVSCDYCKVENGIVKEPRAKLTGTYNREQLLDFIANHYFYDTSCRGFGMTNILCTKAIKREYVMKGLHDGLGMWFGEDQIAMFSILNKITKLCVISDRLYYYVHYKGQASQRYDYSLWESLNRMFESYQRLDVKNIASAGLRIRSWLYITRTINQKMIPAGVSMSVFVRHLKKVLRQSYIQEFFKQPRLNFGKKNEVRYWLLKHGWLRIYYLLFMYRHIRTTYKN